MDFIRTLLLLSIQKGKKERMTTPPPSYMRIDQFIKSLLLLLHIRSKMLFWNYRMVLTTAPPSIQDGMSKSIAYICNLCSTLQFQSIIDLALNLYRPLLGIFHLCFKSRLLFIPTTLLLQQGKCTSQHTSIKNISLQPLNRFQYFSFIILSRSCNSNFNRSF